MYLLTLYETWNTFTYIFSIYIAFLVVSVVTIQKVNCWKNDTLSLLVLISDYNTVNNILKSTIEILKTGLLHESVKNGR